MDAENASLSSHAGASARFAGQADRTHVRGWRFPVRTTHSRAVVTGRALAWSCVSGVRALNPRRNGHVTTVVRPWFGRDERPPASGVSPIR